MLGTILGCAAIVNCVSSCQGIKTEDSSNDAELAEDLSSDKDYFIIPESDTRYIDRTDMVPLGEKGWQMALYEIYARHGMIFSDPEVQEYFEEKSGIKEKSKRRIFLMNCSMYMSLKISKFWKMLSL